MKRNAISVKQMEYKNTELVLCEFMALQEYDIDEWKMPSYKDFNLQEFHDFVADKIEAFDPFNDDRYPGWKRWKYKQERK